jgi:nicotinic acid mononucleotide adenylyltransferase
MITSLGVFIVRGDNFMYKLDGTFGVITGKFAPLHTGHIYAIQNARVKVLPSKMSNHIAQIVYRFKMLVGFIMGV